MKKYTGFVLLHSEKVGIIRYPARLKPVIDAMLHIFKSGSEADKSALEQIIESAHKEMLDRKQGG